MSNKMQTHVISDDDDSADDFVFQQSKIISKKPPRHNKENVNLENNCIIETFSVDECATDGPQYTIEISEDEDTSMEESRDDSFSPGKKDNLIPVDKTDERQIAGTSVIRSNSLPKNNNLFQWAIEAAGNIKKRVKSPLENIPKKRNIMYSEISDDEDTGGDVVAVEVKIPPAIVDPNTLMIAGVNVSFPLKPYGSQIAVMNALIRGCNKEEHALLESPTGSGKTLALLCGALAWQKKYAAEYGAKLDEFFKQLNGLTEDYAAEFYDDVDFDDDFKSKPNKEGNKNKSAPPTPQTEQPKKVPKIYYGSRTHKQITQVISELKKTAYADTKMTILSSRDFTCLQQTNRNKTELCNELLDPIRKVGCPFYSDGNKRMISSYATLDKLDLPKPWDIEDFNKLGERLGSCPYYGARNLMAEAQIIFCPYNYLVDPSIRKSMQISLKNEIVILDEAHNIEDICRDSASTTFRIDEMTDVVKDCESLAKNYVNDDNIQRWLNVIISYCLTLNGFIEITKLECKEGNANNTLTSKYWTGEQLIELMDINKLTIEFHQKFKRAANEAIEHHLKAREGANEQAGFAPPVISLTTNTIRVLEKTIFAIDMISSEEYAKDFRALVKEIPDRSVSNPSHQFFHSTQKPRNPRVRLLELLCMNPGVIFTPLANSARSIILASGTLSPTSSFSSELNTKFPHMLHANHVVPKEQVFIKAITKGPNKVSLLANYTNVNSWNFQDELGQVIVDVCETVPFGVLVFFSSYGSMQTLTNRWWQNGTMTKIHNCKRVFQEPRTNAELDGVMTEYRKVIVECGQTFDCLSDHQQGIISGAVLFAVFRGKVSEGIDFSDNEARCVVTIGIPYAVRTDPAVELKLNYNNLHNREKKLMRGQDWYGCQAYRALNQALGRCIRHKNDWGAILLVDERFSTAYNQANLPNWVKSMWINRNNEYVYNVRKDLKKFVMERVKADNERRAAQET